MMTIRWKDGTKVTPVHTLGTYGEWCVTHTFFFEGGRFAVRHWPTGLRATLHDRVYEARTMAQRLNRRVPKAPVSLDGPDWERWIEEDIYHWVRLHVQPITEEAL